MKLLNKISVLILCLAVTDVSAKQFYRFKNEEGRIIVKDQLTNDMIAAGYEIVGENGQLIQKVGPGKTLQQLEDERLQALEKKKEEYVLKQQIRSDADLLRQFTSVGDIIRTRDAQLLGLEQRIQIQGSKSDLLKLQLEEQQRAAARNERLGQPIPKEVQRDIDSTLQQIANNERNAKLLEEEKTVVAKRYERDIVRYKELESLRLTLKKKQSDTDGSRAVTYDCPNLNTCQKAWQLAQIYAKDNASGQIEIITNTLILTSKPEKDTDVALSFSRIPAPKDKNQIVLEVSCADSEAGADLCKSDKVKSLRKNYLAFLKRRLD